MAGLAAGKDVIVSAVGSARAKDPDTTLYRKAAESLVGALRKLGEKAPRLLVVGGAGSLLNKEGVMLLERLPPERRPESLGQKAALDYYRTVSDVQWTYFSPAGRIEPGERTVKFRLGEDQVVVDERGESRISTEDYAVAMIDDGSAAGRGLGAAPGTGPGAGLGGGPGSLRVVGGIGAPGNGRGAAPRLAHPAAAIDSRRNAVTADASTGCGTSLARCIEPSTWTESSPSPIAW